MKQKSNKQQYMSDETFAELRGALGEALAHARGERVELRTTTLPALPPPPPPMSKTQIARLRKERLRVSQAVFARLLNVNVKTVQGWEQGLRVPSDAALKLLAIANKRPEILLEV